MTEREREIREAEEMDAELAGSGDRGDYYGFIEPDGTIHFVDWGGHTMWAFDWIQSYESIQEEYNIWRKTERPGHDRIDAAQDFLIYAKGWVVFHNPGYGLFVPNYDIGKITRKQSEAVLDLYADLRFEYNQVEIDEAIDRFCRDVDF